MFVINSQTVSATEISTNLFTRHVVAVENLQIITIGIFMYCNSKSPYRVFYIVKRK
jgi:hypothetical protein